jgi:hypothetical protein
MLPSSSSILEKFHHLNNFGLSYLDSLDGVLNLIDTALRGEGVHTTIVVLFAITSKQGVIEIAWG